ncbi:acyl-CoA desaturase [Peredibacter sp. HCB2-198]|uniref:acyl-CoA desaturase n=1 Tax=Peredibacter sp. HCB2-198 TaxID=3383025 RepID=UPI0038B5BCCF
MDKQTIRLVFIHLLVLNVIWTGTSATALYLTLFFFVWRGLFLSISYHRYFSHRSFKTTRSFQFFLALAGNICMQRGALWWAAHHRMHHQYSDTEKDPHSPIAHSFFTSHIGWAMEKKSFITDYSRIKDWEKFPELKFLNERSDAIHGIFALFLFLLGEGLRYAKPELGTNGFQFLVWVYLIGGLCHLHTIFLVNSWGHLHGDRPYDFPAREGRDNSHNNAWLAWLTFGEGWHYNHHCFPFSATTGIQKGQFDASFVVIKLFEKMGLVWDVKVPSEEVIKNLKPATSKQEPGTFSTLN